MNGERTLAPEAITVERLAEMLDCTPVAIRRRHARGQLPAPLETATRRLYWSTSEVREWVAAGMPGRYRWIEIRASRERAGA